MGFVAEYGSNNEVVKFAEHFFIVRLRRVVHYLGDLVENFNLLLDWITYACNAIKMIAIDQVSRDKHQAVSINQKFRLNRCSL